MPDREGNDSSSYLYSRGVFKFERVGIFYKDQSAKFGTIILNTNPIWVILYYGVTSWNRYIIDSYFTFVAPTHIEGTFLCWKA